jgi:hypothetical protein
MADQTTADLPEGTDTVIQGASNNAIAGSSGGQDEGGRSATGGAEPVSASGGSAGALTGGDGNGRSGSGSQGLSDRIRSGSEKLANQAGDRARGLVSQGLERTSEALANVAKMVGDTAPGIEERLGGDYGDYARRAAGSIENVANSIAAKDPDELIEDTRSFVRNSSGIALAGAAVVGFVVARLLKTGLARDNGREDDRD